MPFNDLSAFDSELRLKWRTRAAGTGYPALGPSGEIYDGSRDQKLISLNPDGTVRWAFQLDVTSASGFTARPAVGPDGTVYVGSSPFLGGLHRLYAVSPAGTLRWFHDFSNNAFPDPAVSADGTIYLVSDASHGELTALHPNGSIRWTRLLNSHISAPSVGHDGTLYLASLESVAIALTPDGQEKWRFQSPIVQSGAVRKPSTGLDGTTYFQVNQTLYAIRSNGTLLWRQDLGQFAVSPAIGDNIVVQCTADRLLIFGD